MTPGSAAVPRVRRYVKTSLRKTLINSFKGFLTGLPRPRSIGVAPQRG